MVRTDPTDRRDPWAVHAERMREFEERQENIEKIVDVMRKQIRDLQRHAGIDPGPDPYR